MPVGGPTIRVLRSIAALAASLLIPLHASFAQSPDTANAHHGLSIFGALKYPDGFRHFDYVNPRAPKGGSLRLAGTDSFDTLNPFTLKGVPALGSGLVFDTLMARGFDEPSAVYGLVAESALFGPNGRRVDFQLRTDAKFHDGTPITAADVVFSFRTLRDKGHPSYKLIFGRVSGVQALRPDLVRFALPPGKNRDLAVQIAGLPVLSKAYFAKRRFDETTMDPPLGSGPYRIVDFEPGRHVVYERVKDYWARDIAVNRGRHNFDTVRFDYYRDRDIALQAFLAGEYDFREEFTSVSWATRYDVPAVREGIVKRESIANNTPSGMQAFFFNLRREKFRDRRVRLALNLAFDFEWTNRTIFFGLYRRINSMFENSVYAAHGPVSDAERALLAPLRQSVPPGALQSPFESPSTDGTGRIRPNLKRAKRLLEQAGWRIVDRRLVNRRGRPLKVEFLLAQSSFKRIVLPYLRNLRRLGIQASIRIVDVSNFIRRRDSFDFDLIMDRLPQFLVLGSEQRGYFGSKFANVHGSRNIAGISNKAVDALLDRLVAARDRQSLVTAARALDRVLMWNYYVIPQWYKSTYNIAYRDVFSRPERRPDFALGMLDTWWYDKAKAARLASGDGPAPGAAPQIADSSGQIVAGWEESITLTDVPFPIRAKLDTGADTTSINITALERFEKDGQDHVRFTIDNKDGHTVTLERPVIRRARIRNLDGPPLRRPVVLMEICVGTVRRTVQVSLAGRSGFRNRALIGRNFMTGRILVDSSRKAIVPPNCRHR